VRWGGVVVEKTKTYQTAKSFGVLGQKRGVREVASVGVWKHLAFQLRGWGGVLMSPRNRESISYKMLWCPKRISLPEGGQEQIFYYDGEKKKKTSNGWEKKKRRAGDTLSSTGWSKKNCEKRYPLRLET